MNFMYLVRFSTSLVMKLVAEDDVVVDDTSYGQTNITSSFSIVPLSPLCSSSIYIS